MRESLGGSLPSVRPVTIFISSPSDVREERAAALRAIERLNGLSSIEAAQLVLRPLSYERRVPPVIGERPQRVVDRYMAEAKEADVVVGILWSRMGTPVVDEESGERYPSGTAYELETAYAAYRESRAGPRILLYRLDKRLPKDIDTAQLDGVRSFLARFRGDAPELDGLVGGVAEEENFEDRVFADLERVIARAFGVQPGETTPPPEIPAELELRAWPDPHDPGFPGWPAEPYPLLFPYEHPALLAGRDRELEELRWLLELPCPIAGLHAPSGAGKSSVLAAGLVPALRAEGRPVAFDRDPAGEGLAERLWRDLFEMPPPADLADDPAALVRALDVLADGPEAPPVLVLDQVEELFALPRGDRRRAAVGWLLAASARARGGGRRPACQWLLAYRADFIHEVTAWLKDVLADARRCGLAVDGLPHDLFKRQRFWAEPLPLFGAAKGASAHGAFLLALERPLDVLGPTGEPRYRWRFAGDGAARLAAAFAGHREEQPDRPLVPELQVVLAHLRSAAEAEEGEVVLQVPEAPEELIDRALERHLRRALERAFPPGSPDAAERRSSALLALRELATSRDDGGDRDQRSAGLDEATLAAAIGPGADEVLALLRDPQHRLVIRHQTYGGTRYLLSHDRLSEAVRRLVDEEGARLDPGLFDPEVLALRPFVTHSTRLFESGEKEQSTRLAPERFRALERHRKTLLLDREGPRQRWWQGCEGWQAEETQRRARIKRRRSFAFAATAATVVSLAAAGWWWRGRVVEAAAAEADFLGRLSSREPATVVVALAEEEQPVTPAGRTAALANRGGLVDVLERLPGSPAGVVLRAVEQLRPAIREEGTSYPFDELAMALWVVDYTAAEVRRGGRKIGLLDDAAGLRERLLQALKEDRVPPTEAERDAWGWVRIDGGELLMGSETGDTDERPVRKVRISPFRLLDHEVTREEYRAFDPGHESVAGDAPDDLPATGVTWYEAYTFAAWLGGRLPTEAEWEYAAKGGCQHGDYCLEGGAEAELGELGWHVGRQGGGEVQAVRELAANQWGLYDIYGNVWEWVADWHGDYGDQPGAVRNDPWGPSRGIARVFRGGSFVYPAASARAAYRGGWIPWIRDGSQGFRVLLPAAPSDGE